MVSHLSYTQSHHKMQVEALQADLAAQQEGLAAAHKALFSATEQLQLETKAAEAARQREAAGTPSSDHQENGQAGPSFTDPAQRPTVTGLAAGLQAAEAAVRRAAEQMQAQTLHHTAMMSQAADSAGRELQALSEIYQAHCTLGQLHAEQVQGLQLELSQSQQAAEGLQASLQQKAAEYLSLRLAADADHSREVASNAAKLQEAEVCCRQTQAELAQARAEAAQCQQQLSSSAQALQAAQQDCQAQRAAAHDLDQRLAYSAQQAVEASAAHAGQVLPFVRALSIAQMTCVASCSCCKVVLSCSTTAAYGLPTHVQCAGGQPDQQHRSPAGGAQQSTPKPGRCHAAGFQPRGAAQGCCE